MDIEFLYGLLDGLDELEDKVADITTELDVMRRTLGTMLEYIEDHYVVDEDVDKEDLDGLITFAKCGDPEEAEADQDEPDLVVSFYDAIDD